MAQKRYQLTAAGQTLVSGGVFRFRVGFSVENGGSIHYCSQSLCPIITMNGSDVIGTDNDWAKETIGKFIVPGNSHRGGSNHPNAEEYVFEDVTGSTVEGDVDLDLDTIFPSGE